MKRILLLLLVPLVLISATTTSHAQSTDCKFQKVKDAAGHEFQLIDITGKLGHLYVGKNQGKVVGTYTVKAMLDLFSDTEHTTYLQIDSVTFIFDNNALVKLKAIGKGLIKNQTGKLTYYMENANFSFMIDNDDQLKTFRGQKIQGFKVTAEKGGVFGETYNDKQQVIFQNAFNCLQ